MAHGKPGTDNFFRRANLVCAAPVRRPAKQSYLSPLPLSLCGPALQASRVVEECRGGCGRDAPSPTGVGEGFSESGVRSARAAFTSAGGAGNRARLVRGRPASGKTPAEPHRAHARRRARVRRPLRQPAAQRANYAARALRADVMPRWSCTFPRATVADCQVERRVRSLGPRRLGTSAAVGRAALMASPPRVVAGTPTARRAFTPPHTHVPANADRTVIPPPLPGPLQRPHQLLVLRLRQHHPHPSRHVRRHVRRLVDVLPTQHQLVLSHSSHPAPSCRFLSQNGRLDSAD